MKTDFGSSILLPVVLAGVGIAALCTAIILVPPMARRYADGRPCPNPAAAVAAPAAPAAPPRTAAPAAAAAPAVTPPAPAAPPASADEATAAEPSATTPELNAWSIELDPGDYALLGDADAVIDQIVAVLVRNSKATVSLTGVNHPNKSSKRAKRAAEIVKGRIVADMGVTARQVQTISAQDPAVEGLIVRAEIVGGGR